jgi:hypothetical protein
MTDYANLSDTDIAKLIDDEYAVILASEKANLPRARAIGEKLSILRVRFDYGKWQDHFESLDLTISYETATLYMRLYANWSEIVKLCKTKNVEPTDLTIDAARQLLTKPRTKTSTTTSTSGTTTSGSQGTTSTNNDDPEPDDEEKPPDQVVKDLELDAGDMWEVLKVAYDRDGLLVIAQRLAAHLGMTLVAKAAPPPTTRATPAAATTTTPTSEPRRM